MQYLVKKFNKIFVYLIQSHVIKYNIKYSKYRMKFKYTLYVRNTILF